jgi:transcriptional regulator with XRE-family HTH domain
LSIGERLRTIRKQKNLTLQKVHELTGISIATLSNWENNKRMPTTSGLKKWSKGLGINYEDIFYDDSLFSPTAEELNFLFLIRKLSPSDQDHLLAMLKLMVKKK